jgi:hypothetical protein
MFALGQTMADQTNKGPLLAYISLDLSFRIIYIYIYGAYQLMNTHGWMDTSVLKTRSGQTQSVKSDLTIRPGIETRLIWHQPNHRPTKGYSHVFPKKNLR